MKQTIKSLALLLFAAIPVVLFTSCSDDDDDDVAFPMDYVYGTWDLTNVEVHGTWYDVTVYPYTQFAASATFNTDGTYSGTGYFGNGTGTYKVKNSTLTTYVDGEEYIRYDIITVTSTEIEATMTMGGSSMRIKAKKRQ